MAPYVYRSLAPRQFRILVLHQGDYKDYNLECSLCEVDVDGDIPRYEAISYVWGDEAHTERILCDGKECFISKSLWTVLDILRPTTFDLDRSKVTTRALWVDAICIDQHNLHERAEQVQLMTWIYEGATEVIIWLGELTDLMLTAFRLIDEFVTAVSEHVSRIQDLYATDVRHWVKQRGQAYFHGHNLVALGHFFEHPWFLRAWVFQEVVCARRAVIQCGYEHMEFRKLQVLAAMIQVSDFGAMLPSTVSRNALHQLCQMRKRRNNYNRGSKGVLFRLLIESAGTGAIDARDLLFSKAGIAEGTPLPYPPDYIRAPVTWFRDFAEHTLRTNPGMKAFEHCFYQPGSMAGLPSWAHDWTQKTLIPLSPNYKHRVFHADGKASKQALRFEGNVLTLNAYIVDIVTRAGRTTYSETLANIEHANENVRISLFIDMLSETVEIARQGHLYSFDAEILWQALWRTWFSDCVRPSHKPYERIDPTYERFVNHLKPLITGTLSKKDVQTACTTVFILDRLVLQSAVSDASQRRRFCVTQGGRFGWVPMFAEPDDVIAIVAHVGSPMILRHVVGDSYMVIGSSYIHGIMDGELADMDRMGRETLRIV